MIARDAPDRRRTRADACTSSTSRRGARSRRCARARAAGARVSGEVTPHHLLLTDAAVRALDTSFKMNPPLRSEADRAGARRGAARRDDRLHRNRPRAACARGEEVPFEQAPMGTIGLETAFAGALHRARAARRAQPRDAASSASPAARALFDLATPAIERRRGGRTSASSTSRRAGAVGEAGYESRSANCCFAGRELQRARFCSRSPADRSPIASEASR